jgi:hypothetical protein
VRLQSLSGAVNDSADEHGQRNLNDEPSGYPEKNGGHGASLPAAGRNLPLPFGGIDKNCLKDNPNVPLGFMAHLKPGTGIHFVRVRM